MARRRPLPPPRRPPSTPPKRVGQEETDAALWPMHLVTDVALRGAESDEDSDFALVRCLIRDSK